MNVFYEEDGGLKAAWVLADNGTSLQVEAPHGKRSKIKASSVLLRFERPLAGELMERAQAAAQDLDVDFLWQCCGAGEFGFAELAREYYGHIPDAEEGAAVLLRLHGAPMYFYKKGKGRYKAAPEESLRAALASVERKKKQEELKARYSEQLLRNELPEAFRPLLNELLYAPDKGSVEYKALEGACAATHLSLPRLLAQCGALPSSFDYHFNRFLFEQFPGGAQFPSFGALVEHPELPLAPAAAFSIDDSSTTEIDDAFSVARSASGNWRIGIHIAAPALGFAPGSAVDEIARRRLSTVYMPGGKITMLPPAVIERYTLSEGQECPVLSMYLSVTPDDFRVVSTESTLERIHIGTNLRHDSLQELFNEAAISKGSEDYPYKDELILLWKLANVLESARGKADKFPQQMEYSIAVTDDRVVIVPRMRGTPIDKVVSELMIYVNSEWGRHLADHSIAAIYRTQNAGKVVMSCEPGSHQGLGVDQYAWSSSPLRRYIDLVNQRQLVAWLQGEIPPYANDGGALLATIRDFEAAYEIYGEFQRNMERYWCLRYLLQEAVVETEGTVIREGLVRLARLPLVTRVPLLPDYSPGTEVWLEILHVDVWELALSCRCKGRVKVPDSLPV